MAQKKKSKRRSKKKTALRPVSFSGWTIFWAVLAGLLIGGYFGLRNQKEIANAAAALFSRNIRNRIGALCAKVPFSCMELIYVLAGLLLMLFIVRTVILIRRSDKKWLRFLRRLVTLILIAAYVLAAYCWLYGIDYFADSFAERSRMQTEGVSTEDLYAVTLYFAQKANQYAPMVARDADGHFAVETETIFESYAEVYTALEMEFPFLKAESYRPKQMVFSKVMSAMGFTGVYFPFTGESNINVDPPKAEMAATIAHELAHQRGITAEQECNFLGILACVKYDEPVYAYSGYLLGLTYLSNALNKADTELWKSVRAGLCDEIITDWSDNNAYWEQWDSKVTTVSFKAYSGYLKAQGQELGIASYGACVDLLVTYFAKTAAEVQG